MRKFKYIILVIALFIFCGTSEVLAAKTKSNSKVIAEYQFHGNLLDEKNGSKLTVHGAKTNSNDEYYNNKTGFGTDEEGDYWYWETDARRGGGFIVDLNKILSEDHSVGVRFSFNQTGTYTRGTGYKKIIDYRNKLDDNGFYFYYGKLCFYESGAYISDNPNVIKSNQILDLVAVREKNGDFNVYSVVDGVVTLELTKEKTSSYTIPAEVDGKSRFGFFFDDQRSGPEATDQGKVYALKVWDGAVTPEDIGNSLNEYPDDPVLDLLHPDEKVVTGKTSPNVNVILTLDNQKIVKGRSDDKGNFSLDVPPLKEGDKLSIYAQNSEGFKSEVVKTTIAWTLELESKNQYVLIDDLKKGVLASEEQIKKKIQSKATNLLSGKIEEDANKEKYSTLVSISKEQINALQQVTKTGPYPIDLTYKDNGKSIKKRSWLFVVDTQEQVNEKEGLVFYGDDLVYNYMIAQQITSKQIIDEANVEIYDFNSQEQKISPLASSKQNMEGLSVKNTEIEKIKKVQPPGNAKIQIHYEETGKKKGNFPIQITVDRDPFQFELERSGQQLSLANLELSDEVSGRYRFLEITLPTEGTISDMLLPDGWSAKGNAGKIVYTMSRNNDVVTIRNYLNKLTIDLPENMFEKSKVNISLREMTRKLQFEKGTRIITENLEYEADVPQPIIFEAIDEEGKAIEEGKIVVDKEIRLNQSYEVVPKKIEDYTYKEHSGAGVTGKISNTVQTGKLIYKKNKKSKLTIRFIDLDKKEIATSIVTEYPLNTTVELTKEPEIMKMVEKLTNDFYKLQEIPNEGKIIELTEEKVTIEYVFEGIVGFDVSNIDMAFSQGETSLEEQALNILSNSEKKLVIRDHRQLSKRGNFSIDVTLKQQFTNEKGDKLDNAMIRIKDNGANKITEITDSVTNLYASKETGDNKEISIVLASDPSVPEKDKVTSSLVLPTVKDVGNYKGIIEWSLISGK